MFEPSAYFRIQDICLWSDRFSRHVEYQPGLHEKAMIVQARRSKTVEVLEIKDAHDNSFEILRVLVHLGMRAVVGDPEGEDPGEVPEDQILHEIEATFAVNYHIIAKPPAEFVEEFAAFNCVHNAWPFWRQHVFDVLKRASLPLVEVPFFSGRPPAGRSK